MKGVIMISKSCSLALMLALLAGTGRADWVSLKNTASRPAPPTVTLLQDDGTSTLLKIDVAGFAVTTFAAGGKQYHSISLMSDVVTTFPGSPEVPYLAEMLIVPDAGSVSVEVVKVDDVETIAGYTLPPARPTWAEGSPEPDFVENAAAYSSPILYPKEMATIDEPVVFRDFRAARVAISPVRYDASAKTLHVASSMTVRLRYGGGPGVNPRTSPRRAIPPSFGGIYRSTFINYQSVLDRMYGGLETGRDVLLCIVPDTFANTFQTYRQWKHKTGTFVKFTKFSEIGATSSNPDIIKTYVAQTYHTWEYPPTYLLLGGDYGYVPIKAADGQSFANEDYFVEIDGNDVFPEVLVGRFTHSSNTELQTIINKVIKYERTPYRANQDWFKHAVVCANNAYPTQPETKRWVTNIMRTDGGFLIDTLLNLYQGPCIHTVAEIIAAINSGRSFLNFRGEGTSSGWTISHCYPFNTTDVSSLNNGEMLTFVTSIGCGVANFTVGGGNCFGEQWLELGTPTATRGACAFVGPTWGNTHTKYNNAIDKGIYVAMFQEGLETPAQTLLRGKIRMYNLYGGTDPQVPWHFRAYTVLGDPSTHVWKNVPRKVNILYTPQIAVGFDQIQVTVLDSATLAPMSGAQICVASNRVFATGVTDAAGTAFISLTSTSADTLSIVARGVRVVPAEGTVLVVPDPEHVAPFGDPTITDLGGNQDGKVNPNEHIQISYVMKNWGTQPSPDVQATLAVGDTSAATIVNAGPVSYGTLQPNTTGTPSGTPLQFFVKPTASIGSRVSLRVRVTSAQREWSYVTFEDVVGCSLEYALTLVDDQNSSNRNGRLDPGETANLHVRIRNTGQDVAPNVAGILRTDDPLIAILDSTGSFGTLAIGDSAMSQSDYFVVRVSPSCPIESQHTFTLSLRTQNGNYPYAVEQSFSLNVGLPSGTDPTGPDAYGYYAYSNDDSVYEQAPRFNWMEIRSIGTLVPYRSPGDFTVTATLPFTFKYYGVNYTTVRVSSDGWIAFGSGTQTAYTNYSLPHSDNVNNMVAAFWDDLFESSNNPMSKLLYYSDAANHRFIVEWDSVGHYSGTTLRESFQIILMDPAFEPTTTGDGEIIFQYRLVGEEGQCTIGIENSAQTIGLQYLFNSAYPASGTDIRDGTAIRWTTRPPTIITNTQPSGPIALPSEFALAQNYPNPFNPTTTIRYALPVESKVVVKIFNTLGQEIRTLVEETQAAGLKTLTWNARTNSGRPAASGVYLLHLRAEGRNGRVFSDVRKMILCK
jgi:hypothetical protein